MDQIHNAPHFSMGIMEVKTLHISSVFLESLKVNQKSFFLKMLMIKEYLTLPS